MIWARYEVLLVFSSLGKSLAQKISKKRCTGSGVTSAKAYCEISCVKYHSRRRCLINWLMAAESLLVGIVVRQFVFDSYRLFDK